jgi:uroporphyrin-III C-methyltransferase
MTKSINPITNKGQASIANANSNTLGKVYLVGAGPGAADLITVRGAKLLAQADIVFYDALIEPDMLALCPQAKLVAVGKRCGKLSSVQQFINKCLIDSAHQYQIIVRLKGGDPMLFGRANEEITALKNVGIKVEVIPGITAALAGAACLQQSLTLRGISRSVAFITLAKCAENIGDTQPISNPNADTLIYYMGRKDAVKIARQLIANAENGGIHRRNTAVYILEAISTPRERLWHSTLTELADGKADNWFNNDSPVLIMIGKALKQKTLRANAALESFNSEINNSLQNRKILPNSARRT